MMTVSNEKVIFDAKLKEEKDYWANLLSSELEPSNLPLDFNRPTEFCSEKGALPITLPDELLEKLRQLTAGSLFLTYTCLLSALKICIHKYTASREITIGSPAMKTTDLTMRQVNALALVNRLSGQMSFQQLLMGVRQTIIKAYDNQRYPLQYVVKDLGLVLEQNRSPLFDIVMLMEDLHGDLPDLKNDLTITFGNKNDKLTGLIEFNKVLFKETTIQRFSGHFVNILGQALNRPGIRISELKLLTQAERTQLLRDSNQTRRDFPPYKSIHEWFESRVEKNPDSIAVTFKGEQVSYRELNRRANQLAHHLKSMGIGTEVLVGVCLERGLNMIISFLGVLKAGGAYLSLDPGYPFDRLSFMLEDSHVPVLISQGSLLDKLPSHWAQIVCIDSDWTEIAANDTSNPNSEVVERNLAYVIYTSGSTGRPKGIEIEHGGVCNLAEAQGEAFGVNEGSRVLQFANSSFDASVSEIYVTLLSGGRLVMGDAEELAVGEEVRELMRREGVNMVTLPPSVAGVIGSEGLEKVETVILAGEASSEELVKEWSEGRRVLNGYGPSECTVCASIGELRCGERVTIGKGMKKVRVYVLDEEGEVAGVGVAGEIYIAGAGVGRGYVRRGAETAGVFVPNAYGEEAGGRMYRTGDLGRVREDGEIEYLGRADQQVKVRGYRIEIGEIEAVLREIEGVEEAVVVVKGEGGSEKRLVGYVRMKGSEEWSEKEVKEELRKRVPEYMVPGRVVKVERMPVTANGKIDRRALAALEHTAILTNEVYEAPRTTTEEILATIWSEALSVDRIGINDNFFDLGGHSLLITQVVDRARKVFQVELTVRDIFEGPTINGLASLIQLARIQNQKLHSLSLKPANREGELPLSYAQQRLWFLNQLAPDSAAYNLPGAILLSGQIDRPALIKTLSEVARRHEILRTTFPSVDGKPYQLIRARADIALRVVDLSGIPRNELESEFQRLSDADVQKPFDLADGPLWRISLIRLHPQRHVLLLTMHHIISDAWSNAIFFREFYLLYQAFSEGLPSPLRDLPVQYADFAIWQREQLQGEMLEEQLSYWMERLAGKTTVLDLPTDRQRPPAQSFEGASELVLLSKDLADGLKSLSRHEGATIFITLLAAFQALLYRLTGQNDIVVSTGVANRNRSETESLIGCLINILLLRADLSGEPSFRQLLARVREVALGAYDHQDLPFELLVEHLHPERELSRQPLFQVMFVMLNNAVEAEQTKGPGLTAFSVKNSGAQCDLTFHMADVKGQLAGSMTYNTDIFDAVTIKRMLGYFARLAEAIVNNADQRISEMELFATTERHQIVMEWNDSKTDVGEPHCLHSLFERQARLTPDATALITDNGAMSYRGLNERANQLAHYLRELGAGPEERVGLLLERGEQMVISMMAIVKAGAAYVPMEPAYPLERLQYMLNATQARLLITRRQMLGPLQDSVDRLIVLEDEAEVIDRQCKGDPDSGVIPENLAYVIYTSGSTGRPKGVCINHGGVVNNILDLNRRFGVGPEDRVLAVSSVSFDMCVYEVFASLEAGAAIVLAHGDGLRDPGRWAELMKRHKVSIWNSAPPLLEMYVDHVEERPEDIPPNLRLVLLGGDWVPVTLPDRLKVLSPNVEVISMGGATEASIHSIIYPVKQSQAHRSSIPYGRPMANQQAYMLDSNQQVVGIGVPGELHLGGRGIGRGYSNYSAQTAERYIPDPFSQKPGARLYRTGDLAKYMEDGTIELLGRMDHQVKIRGQRIELGEIEAVLKEEHDVEEVVVAAQEGQGGAKRLVAYIVFKQASDARMSDLGTALSKKLPEYMIPSAFVALDKMPLSNNGKVDRKSLRLPNDYREESEEYIEPRTSTEETLARIWREMLGVERVSVNDNFFQLGGHSLLATRVVSRVREAFQIELPLRCTFEFPTLASLAAAIEQYQLQQAGGDTISAALKELEGLSEQEAQVMLEQEIRLS